MERRGSSPVAPHTHPAAAAVAGRDARPCADDGSPRVLETRRPSRAAASRSADAKVVVSGGRGVGSAGGVRRSSRSSPACSAARSAARASSRAPAGARTPTRSGRPARRSRADLYVACGISGATQHIAGAKGAKKILAINTDPEAPIFASADYAVIGDLHEIVPAISAELRKVQGVIARPSPLALLLRRSSAASSFARRARFLVGLVRAGKPNDRAGDVPAAGAATRSTIVLGQRKLLQRLVPGADARVHLLGLPRPVPDDRDGDDRRSRQAREFPWLGGQAWFALLVDLFVVLVLIGVLAALVHPQGLARAIPRLHLGEADLILSLIAGVVTTLLFLARGRTLRKP